MVFSKAEIANMLDVLAIGNKAARRWSKKILGTRRQGIFHQVMENENKAERLGVTDEELLQMKAIPQEDVEAIRRTWKVTEQLWEQYRRIVYKIVRAFAKKLDITGVQEIADLQSEGVVAFMKSLRGYDDRNFSFSAYFGMAVKTELRRYQNKNRGLTGGNEKLLIAYQEMWRELAAAGEPHAFDDVVLAMGLDADFRQRLWGTLQLPTNECEISSSIEDGDGLASLVADQSAKGVDTDLIEAIGMVEMSLLEADSWKAREEVRELFPDSQKTMKQVAKLHNVTPQAVAFAAMRANSKIASVLVSRGYSA